MSKAKNKKEVSLVDKLFKPPKKDKGNEMPHFQTYPKDYIHQADLLYLPHDKGYKYALVVVDVGTRIMDARALKDKNAKAILKGFKDIYKGGILKKPTQLEVDNGGEFRGETKKDLNEEGVSIRYAKPYRHRQQAIVERKNQDLGVKLFKRMTEQEILTGTHSTQWTGDLKNIVSEINKITGKNQKKNLKKLAKNQDKFIATGDVLDEGTKVRVALDAPKDMLTGKKEVGRFRSADVKWDIKPREIKLALVRPAMPVLYMVDGDKGKHKVEPIGYTRNQLMVVGENEPKPKESSIRPVEKKKGEDLWLVEKVVDKQMKPVILKSGAESKRKEWKYLVKWKGYSSKENTWEPLRNFNEEGRKAIQEYEDSINGSKKKVAVKASPPKKRNTKKVEKEPSKNIYEKVYNTRSRRGRNE